MNEPALGLDDVWADGVCCTGVLVQAPAAAVAALGSPVAVYQNGACSGHGLPRQVKAYVCSWHGTPWTTVEVHERVVDWGGDYLSPLIEQAKSIMGGEIPSVETPSYETPVTTAARLSQLLGVPAIGIWGSDEEPELYGGAFFDQGQLEIAYSVADPKQLTTSLARRASQTINDSPARTSAYSYSSATGLRQEKQPTRKALDVEFRRRGAWFDNSDLLRDLAQLPWADMDTELETLLVVA